MSAVDPGLVEILEAANRTLAARIHTSIPAKVVLYDPATNTVSAEIAVKDFVFDGDGERKYDDAIVFSLVPVMWPRGGGKVVRLPLIPGDTVNLLFSERSLAEWRTTGQTSEPIDSARLSNGYPVAMPGLSPDVKPLSPLDVIEMAAGALIVGDDGGAVQMLIGGTIPGVRFGKLAVSPVALAVPTNAGLAANTAAVAALTTAVAAMVTAFGTHTHPGVTAGAAVTGAPATPMTAPPAAPAAPATVASALVKSL